MSKTAAERNIAAEARGIEEGHRAILEKDDSGKTFLRVVSDSYEGKAYRVDTMPVYAVGEHVSFLCAPMGRMAYKDDHQVSAPNPGIVGCKHAAIAARRLEREGLIEFHADGTWRAAEKAAITVVEPMTKEDLDKMFAGF